MLGATDEEDLDAVRAVTKDQRDRRPRGRRVRHLRRRGYNLRHICIVGAGELGAIRHVRE